ncbi:DUF3492 domain-containing protein [Streptomyces litchfieldiae]|uniref:D-inositol 3-phosphate glycosyltransferase n=1 Tax=Streptomyces litchfieldiae TaxID=3075543 RepID=A0ABU2MM21_9ACTN|nr:DUF3492 domain-containing protein [Streptomyces sp. DSM 44938]MDT0342540.1 DUF3492 domain-containing protein [Streptomyces sp. DSM 44938]
MRVALLTEGGYPYAQGESVAWCDRLLNGLPDHDFDVYALSRGRQQELGPRRTPPPAVRRVRTAPLWGPPAPGRVPRAAGRRFAECFAELTAALCPGYQPLGEDRTGRQADRFASGLYGLAALAAELGPPRPRPAGSLCAAGALSAWLYSEQALRVLESACRAPGAPRAVQAARLTDLLAVTERLERALRPLSLDWYGADALGAARLCHAVGAGPAALPGLLARRFRGTPLLITEYGVRLRSHYLTSAAGPAPGASAAGAAHAVAPSAAGAPVRALLGAFQFRLAREAYARAALITSGDARARRWQERCGADPARLRTVYPGMDARPFAAVARADAGRPAPALVWVGRPGPDKDLAGLLHAFHAVRAAEPTARLTVVATPARGRPDDGYLAHCRALAARLFPGAPELVTFTEAGTAAVPTLADAYAAGDVAVLSSAVEGFPVTLIEAMFCARATVSTDAGAVCEVIGGTGLVVPPGDPRALADACLDLLRDPERRARLGAAARARALELFTVERNVAAFRSVYHELSLGGPGEPPRPSWAREPIRAGAGGREERP